MIVRVYRLCFLLLPLLSVQAYADPFTLGAASSFAVLGGSTVTNTGSTTVAGDLGVSPGSSCTGFPTPCTGGPGAVSGTIYAGNAGGAQSDATASYNALSFMAATGNLTGTDLGGLTLTPGVYKFDSSAQLTGALTLNAEGNNDAVWVFEIGSTLTTASDSSLVFTNLGPSPNDGLFWLVGSSATLGATTAFEGNILASDSITLITGATIDCGRALAQTGAVTMDTNTVSIGCANSTLEDTSGLSGGLYQSSNGGTPSPVPEPGSFVLLGSGLVVLAGVVRRQRQDLSRAVRQQ